MKKYLSLIFLFFPALFFLLFLIVSFYNQYFWIEKSAANNHIELFLIAIFGLIGTIGGILDWQYHRIVLKLKISKKERKAESQALGIGGISMFILMISASVFDQERGMFLIPVIIVLIYTVSLICYDEFVFHRVRCGKKETIYHRMLVFGNGLAWLSWFKLLYV